MTRGDGDDARQPRHGRGKQAAGEGAIPKLPGVVGAPTPHRAIDGQRKRMRASRGNFPDRRVEQRPRHPHRRGTQGGGAVSELAGGIVAPGPHAAVRAQRQRVAGHLRYALQAGELRRREGRGVGVGHAGGRVVAASPVGQPARGVQRDGGKVAAGNRGRRQRPLGRGLQCGTCVHDAGAAGGGRAVRLAWVRHDGRGSGGKRAPGVLEDFADERGGEEAVGAQQQARHAGHLRRRRAGAEHGLGRVEVAAGGGEPGVVGGEDVGGGVVGRVDAAGRADRQRGPEIRIRRLAAVAVDGAHRDHVVAIARRIAAGVGALVARRDHHGDVGRGGVVERTLQGGRAAAGGRQAHIDHRRHVGIGRGAGHVDAGRPANAIGDVGLVAPAFAHHAHRQDLAAPVDAGNPLHVAVGRDDAGHRRAMPAAVRDRAAEQRSAHGGRFSQGHPVAGVGWVGIAAVGVVRCRAARGAVVLARGYGDKIVSTDQAAGQIVVRQLAGIEDGDDDAGAAGAHIPRHRHVDAARGAQVPLAGEQRVRRVGLREKQPVRRHLRHVAAGKQRIGKACNLCGRVFAGQREDHRAVRRFAHRRQHDAGVPRGTGQRRCTQRRTFSACGTFPLHDHPIGVARLGQGQGRRIRLRRGECRRHHPGRDPAKKPPLAGTAGKPVHAVVLN